MNSSEIPVLLLTGYLGSGKTTLLNRILANERGIRFAVIVNDIGEIASLIRRGGVVGGAGRDDLVALQNGCICCTLKMDLAEQLAGLAATRSFDYIVVEASGVCEPAPIAQTICSIPQLMPPGICPVVPRLDCIATVVDSLRMKSEFGCGASLQRAGLADGDIERLVIEQIEFCNVVVLNKVSEVSAGEAARLKAVVRALQPEARIVECDYADFGLEHIIGTGAFDFESVATSATWVREIEGHHGHDHCDGHDHGHCCGHHHHHDEGEAEEYGIQTMVYYRRPAFDMNRFDRFVASGWPESVIRAKGVLYFSDNTDMCYLFEQAGVQKKLTEAGMWYATAPAAELAALMDSEPALRRDWDERYGDRMVKLVFIGRNIDREAISAALDACLAAE